MIEYTNITTSKVNEILKKITDLRLEKAKRDNADKNVINDLESNIDELIKTIVKTYDPSTGYLALKALGLSENEDLRKYWQQKISTDYYEQKSQEEVVLFKELFPADQFIALQELPKCSFTIRIDFKLSKPYISRNDEDFYVIDNPIVRDKVFRIPMVRPSGWKGALSGALYQLELTSDREFVKRVFGEVKESGDEEKRESGTAGRMHIYPSFFLDAKTGVEVINPRERKSQAGTKPIPFEVVKQGSSSTFSMLYVPFDCIGKNDDKTISDIQKDVRNLLQGIQGMFRTYGFGAKTSSGFGTAEDACKVEIRIKGGKVPILATNFSELTSEQKIKEVTDSIQKGGE